MRQCKDPLSDTSAYGRYGVQLRQLRTTAGSLLDLVPHLRRVHRRHELLVTRFRDAASPAAAVALFACGRAALAGLTGHSLAVCSPAGGVSGDEPLT